MATIEYDKLSVPQLQKLAESGFFRSSDTLAQFNLALRYSNGQGVPKDEKEAVRLYRLAAEQGNAAAQTNLGWMYANGQGVTQDEKEAVRLYRLAAEQGEIKSKVVYGRSVA